MSALQGRRFGEQVQMVTPQTRSTIAFLHSLTCGGDLVPFLPSLQPVVLLGAHRADFTACAVAVSHLALTQAAAFGAHRSWEQNARRGAAPGLQACLSASVREVKMPLDLLSGLGEHILWPRDCSTPRRCALLLLFSVPPEQH